MVQNKKIILLSGPTASGKSKLAIRIAQHLNGEIVNADSMQIYKEICILTSRPSSRDEEFVKHHLYGFRSVKKIFSVGAWLQIVSKNIKWIWKKGKIPIVVGGTGLYFKALTEGLSKIPNIPPNIRNATRKLHNKIGQDNFFKKLIKLDPSVKKFILSTDPQRSMRAYEIKKFTNKSFLEFMKKTKPKFKEDIFIRLFINFPRDLLNERIGKRVEKMFELDVITEVKKLKKISFKKELPASKIIGIREIEDYLLGKITLKNAKELIKQKTRRYAKRQFTWARGHMKSWKMIYSPNTEDLYKKTINKIS